VDKLRAAHRAASSRIPSLPTIPRLELS
jgi:hypothetical protein